MICPVCSKPADTRYRPFCSRRCADVDLGRWLNESYRIPDAVTDEDDASSDDLSDGTPTPHGKLPH